MIIKTISAAHFINSSHQSVWNCILLIVVRQRLRKIHSSICARQRLHNSVSASTNTNTSRKITYASISMGSISFQRRCYGLLRDKISVKTFSRQNTRIIGGVVFRAVCDVLGIRYTINSLQISLPNYTGSINIKLSVFIPTPPLYSFY
jgi:hypothetical protein